MQLSCKTLNLADVLSLGGNCSTSLGFLYRLGLVSNCVYTWILVKILFRIILDFMRINCLISALFSTFPYQFHPSFGLLKGGYLYKRNDSKPADR